MNNKRHFYLAIFLFLVYILVLNGCTNIFSSNKLEDQNANVDGDKEKIIELEGKIGELENENQSFKNKIEDLSLVTRELGTDYNYYLNNYYYYEDTIQTMLGYKQYNGEEPIALRALPYSDAIEVNSGFPSEVNVISTVRNKLDEHWALVAFPETKKGRNNYGFIKVEYLEEYNYTGIDYSKIDISTSIEGINIGDFLEKAIAVLGIDYFEMRGKERGFIHYGEASGSGEKMVTKDGVDIFYNLQTHNIWGIRVQVDGYETEAGFGVGDNALEAVDYYKKKYKMNGEEKFDEYFVLSDTAFELEDDYYLEFKINTDELNESSIITDIEIFPIGWGIG